MEHDHEQKTQECERYGQLVDWHHLGIPDQPHRPQDGVTQLADHEYVGGHIGEGVDSVICEIKVIKES